MPNTLFTVILEFEGTTSVSQFSAVDPEQAFQKWQERLDNPVEVGLRPDRARALAEALQESRSEEEQSAQRHGRRCSVLVPLQETTNVWCVSELVGRKLALINIVGTVTEQLRSETL